MRLVAGRYELIDHPIPGSMGEVYGAHDTHLDREVAVKLIHRDLLGGDLEPELVRRFQREARLTAHAAHPGVPTVHDVGADDGRHYVVMELITGATIGDLINEIDSIPAPWAVFITAQVCAVLTRTHAISLIHRDLKPDNIMLCTDGTIKVVDFGTAVLVEGSRSSNLTPPGVTIGDSRYQAPERFLGMATPRSDLFSLGRVLHEMLTDPTAPSDLHRLADDLTQDQPQNRPTSAAEVYRRLQPLHEPLPPLAGFVAQPLDTALRMYHDLTLRLSRPTVTSKAPTSGRSGLTPRQARARAESHAADGQFSRAIAILDAAIAETTDPHDPALVDLHRDLVRILIEARHASRAVTACSTAIQAMRQRFAANHPAMLAVRLMHAHAHGLNGDIHEACELYQAVLDDLRAEEQLLTPHAVTARRELAIQLAARGDVTLADQQLRRLLDDLAAILPPGDPELEATKEAATMVAAGRIKQTHMIKHGRG